MIRGERQELEAHLVELLVQHIEKLLLVQDHVVVGVPGGTSVVGVFEKMSQQQVDWTRIHICMVDERLVESGHVDSNFRLLKEAFRHNKDVFLHPVVKQQIKGDEALRYTDLFNELGGQFDIILLSSGEDGHVAALFPEHPILTELLCSFVTFTDSPKPPSARLTASLPLLSQAKVGFLLFFGDSKRDALKLFESDVDIGVCPAKLIEKNEMFYTFTDINGN